MHDIAGRFHAYNFTIERMKHQGMIRKPLLRKDRCNRSLIAGRINIK